MCRVDSSFCEVKREVRQTVSGSVCVANMRSAIMPTIASRELRQQMLRRFSSSAPRTRPSLPMHVRS